MADPASRRTAAGNGAGNETAIRPPRHRRTLPTVELEVGRIAALAGRPISALTRRDVALGLLSVGPDDALASLPALRRRLLAAGNPMSAPRAATEGVFSALRDGHRPGDVREWLEATGTEPGSVIGLHVWDEAPEQSQLQAEMHAILVRHLEEKQAAGEIDPGSAAGRRHRRPPGLRRGAGGVDGHAAAGRARAHGRATG